MISQLVLSLRYLARSTRPRPVIEQSITKAKEQAADLGHAKQHDPDERVDPDDIDEAGLAKVRLDDQHLPLNYLKRAQQVFGKYDQEQLRDIANKFSELMSLRYQEKKFDYANAKPFTRVKPELPQNRKVQQIHLVGEEKSLQPDARPEDEMPKDEEKPVGVSVQYNQNAVLSYLLKRVPRTFATAVRIMIEIRYKYPKFKPTTMIDFGSGLSSGSYAFADVFQQTSNIFNVQPNEQMFKLSKFLSQDIDIQHFRALGQLSRIVKDADLVYAGYVLNEIESEKIPIYVEALWTKVRPGGFLVIAQYGNPYSARLIHDVRQWAINKSIKVVMPCPHQQTCPLASTKRWCHFDQPAGAYTRRIFGKLPTEHAIQLQKFSYIVMEKPGDQQLQSPQSMKTNEWDRIIFPPIVRGGHIMMDICTTSGKMRKLIAAKSHGQQYKEAKRLRWGDLWRFGERMPNKFRKESKKGKRLW